MEKREILARCFGYSELRPGQENRIDGVLPGRDVLGLMPTGRDRRSCYQVPARMLKDITLVVSPLIYLMRDQVLGQKAAWVPADYINSTLTGLQMQAL